MCHLPLPLTLCPVPCLSPTSLFTFPQVCLFDLDYGLPVQVRDTALGIEKEDVPQSDVGKEFQLNEQIKKGETDSSFSGSRPNDILLQLQRTGPYYKVRVGVWVCQQQQQDHGNVRSSLIDSSGASGSRQGSRQQQHQRGTGRCA